MIYEIALLRVHSEKVATFRSAFYSVAPLLKQAKGYKGHFLTQGIETPNIFHLIVRWQLMEDYALGSGASVKHQRFMEGLQDYFVEEPVIYQIETPAFTPGQDDDFINDMSLFMSVS